MKKKKKKPKNNEEIRKVISICGLPGAGKTTAIKAIEDLGVVISMGDVVRNEAKKRDLEPSANNIGEIAKLLREKHGSAIIAKECVELIKNREEDVIIVDGVRSLSEIEIFRRFWKFPIIAIVADEEIRLRRLFERTRSDDPKTIKELRVRDQREIGFGLDKVIENADYKIQNNSSIEDLKKKTRELVINIINSY